MFGNYSNVFSQGGLRGCSWCSVTVVFNIRRELEGVSMKQSSETTLENVSVVGNYSNMKQSSETTLENVSVVGNYSNMKPSSETTLENVSVVGNYSNCLLSG